MTGLKTRLSSTVVVLLKWGNGMIKPKHNLYDYKIMMVKRTEKIKAFPGAHVFPGGSVDQSDHDPRWNTLYPNIKDLPSKIAALREVFEETNFILDDKLNKLLFTSKLDELDQLRKTLNGTCGVPSSSHDSSINNNDNVFYDFISKSSLTPTLSNLYQWARWVTPIGAMAPTHRFNTLFYIAPIETYPTNAAIDNGENVQLDWFSPDEALHQHNIGNIALPPPTWLTIQQLSHCHTIEQAVQLAKQRQEKDIPYEPKLIKPTISASNLTSDSSHVSYQLQVLKGDILFDNPKIDIDTIGPKNRIVTYSRSGNLANHKTWYYSYQNTVPKDMDELYNNSKSNLINSKL
ncbi:hypothetical protein CYY_007611 [Polysphondylium violaceum]|uniref:Nudix hydrolase domain-containing protein n=1 Tax=Polysphondylium violaceum TaxID=133409 RepID=A0A8J4PRN5_9MYCE|nr:hypothetical protein CYY_007611 [Polysphondylium violaceum]